MKQEHGEKSTVDIEFLVYLVHQRSESSCGLHRTPFGTFPGHGRCYVYLRIFFVNSNKLFF